MEELSGQWRQISHLGFVNGILCNINPPADIIWEFAPKGIMTQSSLGQIHCINRVSWHDELGILLVRPDSMDRHTIYSVRPQADGTIVLRSFNRQASSITLLRM